jgi:predicted anti-sigma-YlaC factor YlaD
MNTGFCQREQITAYVDGELDSGARSDLEQHIENCMSCSTELRVQRMFLCELDSALTGDPNHSLPEDFAAKVAAYAESDMSGVRDRTEHKRALQFSLGLALAAFVLLGAATGEFITTTISSLISRITGLTGFFAGTFYETAASATVISRVIGESLILDALPGMVFLLLILAILLLSLLIASYHRTRAIE